MDKHRTLKSIIPISIKQTIKDLAGITPLQERAGQLEKYNEQLEADIRFLRERVDQLEERLCESGGKPLESRLVSGCIDRISYDNNILTISGWILLPQRAFDSLVVYVNGTRVAEASVTERSDIERLSPFTSHAKNSGFSLSVNRAPKEMQGMIDVAVAGVINGVEIAKIETWYQANLYSCIPVPPSQLIRRVTNHESSSLYLVTGLQCYREFWTTIKKYATPESIRSMLDWGCGCGRIVGFFSKFSGIPRICGCDIDGEAIAWCRENLPEAEFSVIPPYPPTSYPDNSFDLIISCSVLTHLPREVQFSWLQEMQRILAPGGLFLPSIHGEAATRFSFPGKRGDNVLMNGICDTFEDKNLDRIAPKGYYRGVFQTRQYTLKEWSRYFDILEYKERGAFYYQDMLVMRKKG
jgi:SAM-dependent methyltransferase